MNRRKGEGADPVCQSVPLSVCPFVSSVPFVSLFLCQSEFPLSVCLFVSVSLACHVGIKSGASDQASAGEEVTGHADRDRQAPSRR